MIAWLLSLLIKCEHHWHTVESLKKQVFACGTEKTVTEAEERCCECNEVKLVLV